MIVSGHRRVNACKQLGIEVIDFEYREYSETVEIEPNRYRDKSIAEKSKKAHAYRKIFSEKAKAQQVRKPKSIAL